MVQLTTNHHDGADNGLSPVRRQAIISTNNALVYWRKYTPLGYKGLSSLWHLALVFHANCPLSRIPTAMENLARPQCVLFIYLDD